MEGFNGFPFPNNYSSSFSSGSSSVNNPKHEEAVMKKIVEAVELLEKQAKIGKLPQDSVQEIKQELKKKYPNISFSSENDAQKPQNTDHSQNNSTLPNSFPNDPFFAANHFINQINQQQQLNNAIFQQAQLASNQAVEQYMRMIGVPRTYTNPVYSAPSYPYFDATTFPSYHNNTTPSTNYGQMSGDAMKMAFEMMGNMNNQEAISPDAFSSLAGFGGDDSSASATALSFLGSLLGGSGL